MFSKGSKLYSIFRFRCPQCHEGKLFKYSLYNMKKIGQMESSCPNCGLKYSKEPGFFFGAAYVSYGLTVAFAIALYVLSLLFAFEYGWKLHLTVVIVGLILLFPIAYALSRSIWLNMFFKYKKAD